MRKRKGNAEAVMGKEAIRLLLMFAVMVLLVLGALLAIAYWGYL